MFNKIFCGFMIPGRIEYHQNISRHRAGGGADHAMLFNQPVLQPILEHGGPFKPFNTEPSPARYFGVYRMYHYGFLSTMDFVKTPIAYQKAVYQGGATRFPRASW